MHLLTIFLSEIRFVECSSTKGDRLGYYAGACIIHRSVRCGSYDAEFYGFALPQTQEAAGTNYFKQFTSRFTNRTGSEKALSKTIVQAHPWACLPCSPGSVEHFRDRFWPEATVAFHCPPGLPEYGLSISVESSKRVRLLNAWKLGKVLFWWVS